MWWLSSATAPLTGGLAYEGLNNAGRMHCNPHCHPSMTTPCPSQKRRLHGAVPQHIRTKPGYIKTKNHLESSCRSSPWWALSSLRCCAG